MANQYPLGKVTNAINLLKSYSYSTGLMTISATGGTASANIITDNEDFYINQVVITARDTTGKDIPTTTVRDSFTINVSTNQKRKFQDNNNPELFGFVNRFSTLPNLGLPIQAQDQLQFTLTSIARSGNTLTYPCYFQVDLYGYTLDANV
jgi:hypothetical protein